MSAIYAGPSIAEPDGYKETVSKAISALETGNCPDSFSALQQALVYNANDPLAHVALGVTYLMSERVQDAASEFKTALTLNGKCGEAQYGVGLIYLNKGDLGQAASAFAQAQSLNPSLNAGGAIEYVKALAAGTYSPVNTENNDESLRALNALSLIKNRKFAEAIPIWNDLRATAVRPNFGERIGFAMTFTPSKPIVITGWGLSKSYRTVARQSKNQPSVSGRVVLRADLHKATGVDMVAFLIDNKLAGITNHPPYQYTWDTTEVANGLHTVKIQGLDSQGFVISDKSTNVEVKNDRSGSGSPVGNGDFTALWRRLWSIMALKPSVASINYNLAHCASQTGDVALAKSALEQVLAANPNYLDAADRLTRLYGATRDYTKISRVKTTKKLAALTFDDGPKEHTADILAILKQKGVNATFFVVGKQIALYPDMLKRIVDEGNEVENHTYNHCDLEYLSETDVTQEVFRNISAVKALTGRQMQYLRPPGGHEGKTLPIVMRKFGLRTVFWTVNCSNLEGTTEANFRKTVVSSTKPGSVILMHNPERVTLLALPGIIDSLRKQGYTLVTLSEMVSQAQ